MTSSEQDPFALDARVSIPEDPGDPGLITTITRPITARLCTRYPICTTLGCTTSCIACTTGCSWLLCGPA